ncbi:MAG: hypothetical protein AB7F31_07325 [Parachlamydiales bacterium]
MIESAHLFPQLNRDVEQQIWSFLDLPDLDRVAMTAKGGGRPLSATFARPNPSGGWSASCDEMGSMSTRELTMKRG